MSRDREAERKIAKFEKQVPKKDGVEYFGTCDLSEKNMKRCDLLKNFSSIKNRKN